MRCRKNKLNIHIKFICSNWYLLFVICVIYWQSSTKVVFATPTLHCTTENTHSLLLYDLWNLALFFFSVIATFHAISCIFSLKLFKCSRFSSTLLVSLSSNSTMHSIVYGNHDTINTKNYVFGATWTFYWVYLLRLILCRSSHIR